MDAYNKHNFSFWDVLQHARALEKYNIVLQHDGHFTLRRFCDHVTYI